MIVIGEKINATRKGIARAILAHDRAAIVCQVERQDKAGAHFIDLNVGTGSGDTNRETGDMRWLIDIVLETTEKSLSIDSPNPQVIRDAAEHLAGRRSWMINSIKNEETILAALLPLAVEHQVPVIALAMDGNEIPENATGRLDACRAIAAAASEAGLPLEQVFFDPLVMPLSANHAHGQITLEILQGVKAEFPGVKTTMGLSNISFGLRRRSRIDAAFLIAAASHGLDSAICDPTDKRLRRAILLGKLIAGKDRFCRGYSRAERKGVLGD